MQIIEMTDDDSFGITFISEGDAQAFTVSVVGQLLTIVSETGNLIVLPGGNSNCIGLDVYRLDKRQN